MRDEVQSGAPRTAGFAGAPLLHIGKDGEIRRAGYV